MTNNIESPGRRRTSFAGWEQLLGLDGTAPPVAGESGGQAVLYLRVSTQRQMHTAVDIDADGNSIATQRELCVKRCKRLKAPIAETFVEPGNSAQSIAKRPVFRELLSYIEEHPDVGYVVIYMRSRIFRNQADAAITKRILAGMGVKLISAKEEFGDGYMADAMEAITDIMNEVQVRQSGEDIKNKLLHKAKNGGTVGRAKLGYLNVRKDFDGRLVNTIDVDPVRAPLIKWAFEQYATGDYSIAQLHAALMAQGMTTRPTARWKAGPISRNQLDVLLRDPYYLGMVTFKGQLYPGRHEAIVDTETFERVQRVLEVRSRPTHRDRVHAHFLRGLLYCDRCEQAGRSHRLIYSEVTNRTGQVYEYFMCRGRQESTCDLHHLPTSEVEHAVAEELRKLSLPADFIVEARGKLELAVDHELRNERESRGRLQQQLRTLEAQEHRLLDLAGDGELALSSVKERLRKVSVERLAIEERLIRTDSIIRRSADTVLVYLDLLQRPHDFYAAASDATKRKILAAFFAELYIDEGEYAISVRGVLHEVVQTIENAAYTRTPHLDGDYSLPSSGNPLVSCLSKGDLVGLVEMYSRKSADAGHFRKLAALEPSRRARGPRVLPQQARRLTASELVEFKAQYLAGVPITSLASAFGIHRSTVINIASRLNLSRSRKVLSDEEIKVATVYYTNGDTLAMVAARFTVGTETMRSALIAAGIRIRARGRQRRSK